MELIVVTGGAGFIGAQVCLDLVASGHQVRAFDVLQHDQQGVAEQLQGSGVELIRADIRDPTARERALSAATAVVHLAAIVGDPACALEPELALAVNIDGTHALATDAERLGVKRFVFASTCSTYGSVPDPDVAVDESGVLVPVSLYARQKAELERWLLDRNHGPLAPIILRFATVYGVAPRMRFDLTVNEFVRDLWADRTLEVFGENYWRSCVHVRDAGRAIRLALEAPIERVAGEVFNVGRPGEDYTKLDLLEEIRKLTDRGRVEFVHRDVDPRHYKVNFAKIHDVLGFEGQMTVPDGIAEVFAGLDQHRFGDPFDGHYRNLP